MITDDLTLVPDAAIYNAHVEPGTAFPSSPTIGRMYYLTTNITNYDKGLYIYDGATWQTGDITSVTAGLGLSGGGTSGALTLDIDVSESTSGHVLTSTGSSSAPTWQASSGGGNSAIVTIPGDTSYSNVGLLLHFIGTNGSTNIIDSSPTPKTVTVGGQAVISTTQSKFDGSALYIDGASVSKLTVPASSNIVFGTSDFTLEMWVYPLSSYGYRGTFYHDGNTFAVVYDNTGERKVDFWVSSEAKITGTTSLSLGNWYHFALCRSGSSTRMFINGIQEGATYTDTNNYTTSGPICIAEWPSWYSFTGYLDELRITKGVARYTSNFTPVAYAYPNGVTDVTNVTANGTISGSNLSGVNTGNQTITLTGDVTGTGTGSFAATLANTAVTAGSYGSSSLIPVITVDSKGRITSASATSATGGAPGGTYNVVSYEDANFASVALLLHCDGTNGSTIFLDNSTTPKTASVHGATHISTDQYVFGGSSAYFNGTEDYLSYIDNVDYHFGSGDFTIELWVRITSFSNQNGILSKSNINAWSPYRIITKSAGSSQIVFQAANTVADAWAVTGNTGLLIGTLLVDTWAHVAISRSGNSIKTFLNGIAGESTTSTLSLWDNTEDLTIGATGVNGGGFTYLTGYIDDVRLTKGVARYTTDFTPPNVASVNTGGISTYTSLQTNNNGDFGGPTTLIWDNTNKYLGVNKATPAQALDVVGNITATGTLTLGTPLATTQGGTGLTTLGTSLQVLRTNTGATGLEWGTVSSGGGSSVTLTDDTTTNATYYPTFATVNSGTLSAIDVASTKLTFNPSTGTLFATNMATSSDKTLKHNILPLTNGLDIINQLKPSQFNWNVNNTQGYGVIAQDLEKVIPSLVEYTGEYKSVKYIELIGFLIAAVQDLSQQVTELQNGC